MLLIGRDSLPSLQELDIHGNRGLGIDGVTVLTQGLQASSLTKLTGLDLMDVGLDDAGIKILTNLIESGEFGDAEVVFKPLRSSSYDYLSDSTL